MSVLSQILTEIGQLEAAAEVFQDMLAECKAGTARQSALQVNLAETGAEIAQRRDFAQEIEAAQAACKAFRQRPTARAQQALLGFYADLLVRQANPLSGRLLRRHAPMGSGCRACALRALEALEIALGI